MKTYSAKPSEISKKWYVVDADGVILGRLASILADRLRGKRQDDLSRRIWTAATTSSSSTPRKVKVTGNKLADKVFYYHTGYPGGIKERTFGQILGSKHPERLIEKAVERMVPRGPLGRQQMKNLRVYPGTVHPMRRSSRKCWTSRA